MNLKQAFFGVELVINFHINFNVKYIYFLFRGFYFHVMLLVRCYMYFACKQYTPWAAVKLSNAYRSAATKRLGTAGLDNINFTEIIYLYLFGMYNMSGTTGNHFNIIIIQCVNVTQLILYIYVYHWMCFLSVLTIPGYISII